MSKNDSLYNALRTVHRDALAQKAMHEACLESVPLIGWTLEKHKAYHEKHCAEAQIVIDYLFVRMMQIDPD